MISIKKVNIHYSLLLYILLCAYTGFIELGLSIILILLIHEFSHIMMIKAFNGNIKRIDLTLIGGLMDIELKNATPFRFLLIDLVRPS